MSSRTDIEQRRRRIRLTVIALAVVAVGIYSMFIYSGVNG